MGDRHVIDEMLRHGFNFGGEQSGHMIFRDYSTTGDGLVAALQILRIMRAKDMPLSALARCWTRFPQIVTNIVVREKRPFEELDRRGRSLWRRRRRNSRPRAAASSSATPARNPKRGCCSKAATAPTLEKWTQKIAEAIKRQVGG